MLMAVHQAGWNYVPLNSNLTAAELSYILADAGAKAFIADQRFATEAAAAADQAGVPASGRLSVGAIDGLHRPRRRPGRPVRPDAGPPRGRAVHAVHLGHDRATQGGATRAPVVRPRDLGRRLQREPLALRD